MDVEIAREYLTAPKGKKTSEIGEAVDVLYREYSSYKAIAQKLKVSPSFLSSRHRIFQLPKGIQWKIDQEQISIRQSHQISRLKSEDDQWLLAFVILEEELAVNECKNVVDIVVKQNKSIRDALSISTGVRFDKIQPLLLPIRFDLRLAICRSAWSQGKDWADLCYQLIRQGIDLDIKEVAIQLEALASDLRKAGQKTTK